MPGCCHGDAEGHLPHRRGADQLRLLPAEHAGKRDTSANTSDGIFVFQGVFPDLRGGYVPTVGDEIVVQGRVSEFFSMTQLSSATLVERLRTGVDVEAEAPSIEAAPPSDLAAANRWWERREGMSVLERDLERVRVAHINADWPADFAGDGARGASDHDPVVSRFEFSSDDHDDDRDDDD